MAETVVGGALLRVFEDVVGLVDFLELMLAILVPEIAVGMDLHRELAKGGLPFRLDRPACHAQHFVIVALRHRDPLLAQDDFSPNRHPTPTSSWNMIPFFATMLSPTARPIGGA